MGTTPEATLITWPDWVPRIVRPILARIAAVDFANALFRHCRSAPDPQAFVAAVIDAMKITVETAATDSLRATAGVIVACTHPTGVVDALSAAAAVWTSRTDIRILANAMVCDIPNLGGLLIAVDVFGGARCVATNATAVRQALRWLEGGGVLIVFPSGEVAHTARLFGAITESPWPRNFGRFVRLAGVPVVPCCIDTTSNSRVFHALGHVHPLLRTVQLLREFRARAGKTVVVTFGAPYLPPREATPEAIADTLRVLATDDNTAIQLGLLIIVCVVWSSALS